MFESFFPKPKLFLISVVVWTIVSVGYWYLEGLLLFLFGLFNIDNNDLLNLIVGGKNLGKFIGLSASEEGSSVIGLAYFVTPEFIWFDIYYILATLIFFGFWSYYCPHKWQNWSILGSSFLIFFTYLSVQVSVVINAWYGPFYNDIQKALGGGGEVTAKDLYDHLLIFAIIVFPYLFFASFKIFFNQHYLFRWRNAMNDFYTERWSQLRHVEGASQRIQEDTKQFSRIMKNVGIYMVDSVMTLIAFMPVLTALSIHVKDLPLIGQIPNPLVTLAILWAVFATVLLLVAGIKLPGLEFRNERVEAAFRKELVLGEDSQEKAELPTLVHLFNNVRRNYFRLYFHYAYFNLFRYFYIQTDNIIIYIFLIPTIVSGRITLGIMTQITRAFSQVANAFQFLANSWPSIIELMSIYKRLQAFEKSIYGGNLSKIDQEFVKNETVDDK